jgi:hypothetical protein
MSRRPARRPAQCRRTAREDQARRGRGLAAVEEREVNTAALSQQALHEAAVRVRLAVSRSPRHSTLSHLCPRLRRESHPQAPASPLPRALSVVPLLASAACSLQRALSTRRPHQHPHQQRRPRCYTCDARKAARKQHAPVARERAACQCPPVPASACHGQPSPDACRRPHCPPDGLGRSSVAIAAAPSPLLHRSTSSEQNSNLREQWSPPGKAAGRQLIARQRSAHLSLWAEQPQWSRGAQAQHPSTDDGPTQHRCAQPARSPSALPDRRRHRALLC